MSKVRNTKSKKIYICHDFTRKPRMFNLNSNNKLILKKKFKNIEFVQYKKNSKKINLCEIYWGDLISQERILSIPDLKWIHLASSGIDKLIGVKLKSIKVSNSRGLMSEAVSNSVFSYVLYFTRGIRHIIELRVKKKLNRFNFDKCFDDLKILSDCSFLVFGNGNISKNLIKLLKNFSKKVSVISKRDALKAKIKNRKNLKHYDFVINLLPKDDLLNNYFDKTFFQSMSNKSYFINVGRGDAVNEEKLYSSLRNNVIKGAALDVFKKEPLNKSNKFLKLKNCFVSPHTAGWFNNYWIYQTDLFMHNLECFKKGKKLRNQIKNVY